VPSRVISVELLKCSSAHFFSKELCSLIWRWFDSSLQKLKLRSPLRVRNFLELATPVRDDFLSRFAQVARDDQQRAAEQGAKSDTDPLLAAPVISEAWCNARDWPQATSTGTARQRSSPRLRPSRCSKPLSVSVASKVSRIGLEVGFEMPHRIAMSVVNRAKEAVTGSSHN
jgi:hypothetical protein